MSDATGPCARPFCALPGAYRLEFGKPGGYTLAGKEYADPTFTPTVCAFSYAHGGPKILHLNTATYGDEIYQTCKFLRTHVLKRFPLPRIGWDWELRCWSAFDSLLGFADIVRGCMFLKNKPVNISHPV